MENFVVLLIPALLGLLLIRLLATPVKWVVKLIMNGACGFLCLWLLNTVSGFTGIQLPINAVTVVIAGSLGLPGIGLLAVLAVLA